MKKNLRFVLALAIGWLTSVGAMAIEPVDGVYQIGSAQDWKEFAAIVNSDGRQHKLNAVVTQDFSLSELVMVGAPSNAYSGTFDGQGHTITIDFTMEKTGNDGECGLFCRINGATIKNLTVAGTINTNGQLAGGVVSGIWQTAVVENCISTVTITDTNGGDGTHGGIVARISDRSDVTIRNCAFLGTINAPGRAGSGGILGWPDNGGTQVKIQNCLMAGTLNLASGVDNDVIVRNSATVTNCYFVGLQNMNNSKNATEVTAEKLGSGEICFLLNGSQSTAPVWYQTIGTDAAPLPLAKESAVVYVNGSLNCDGTPKAGVTYSNTQAEAERDAHQWDEWGFCTECKEMQPDFITPVEGFYEIATKQQYNWFALFVNKGNPQANARLTADLDLSDYTFVPIGVDGANYAGTFDGQGHRVKNMTIDGSKKEQGFFSTCQGGAVIKNLIIDSSCKMVGTGGANVAALIGCINHNNFNNDVVLIENVGNEMSFAVTTTNNAGFVARDFSNFLKLQIKNCYNTGNITGGTENGAFTAWTPKVTLTNCWNTGRIEATGGYDGSTSLARGNQPVRINAYDLNAENTDNAGAPEGYTAEWLTSGLLAYELNGKKSTDVVWYQKLGENADTHPYPFGTAIVYANGQLDCAGNAKEGTTVTYSNTEGSTRDEHQFVDGFCTACGHYDADYLKAEEGVFSLAKATDVKWFAAYVNDGHGDANARLTADVDFADVAFTGIGNVSNHYTGTFDGQGHVVKNMVIEQPDVQGVGFFNEVDNGAVIKNFTIDASCSVKAKAYAGAFVGHVSGVGTALLECLGNEGSVETVNQNAGALVGCNTSGELKLTIKNCYNAGAIKSGNEAGGLSGWFGNDAITENCYNMGTVAGGGSESFARGNNIQITNCFDPVVNWPAITHVNMEDFTNGVVYAKLSEAAPYVWYLSAAEGGHPVLYKTDYQMVVVKSDYAGNEVADGDFFIYNPASGLWLQNNDKNTGDWNTRGATGDYGFEFGISAIDGGYQLNPKFGKNHSFNISNFYLDTDAAVSAWKLEKLNTQDGVVAYQIKADDGRVLSLNDNNNLDWNTGRATEWQLVTKADRIKFMKENASEENPVDATFLISDPRFVNENERAAAWNWDMNLDGGARDDVRWYWNRRSYAIWNSKSFKLSQVIANVPNGQYKLTLKGYYRDGDKDQVVARRQAGEERILANYFINEDKAPMMSILDGASENWVDGLFFYPAADATAPYGHYPDNADGFNRIFQDYPNSYLNAGVTSQVTTGQMTIGLEKLEKNEKDWLAFDDFSLVYMGNSMGLEEYLNALRTAIEAAEAFDATTTSTALAGALADALSDAKAKLTSVEEGEIETATANLNAALNAAKAVNIVALKATADLAKTEVDADALASVTKFLNDATTAAETAIAEATTAGAIEQALYDLTAARKINALSTTATYKGSTPAAGKVYLFNVGTGMFMGTGSDWNTHAAVDQVGIEIELVDLDKPETNNFKFKTGRGDGWMAYNGYVDTRAQDIWHFLPVDGQEGVYNISSTGQDGFLLGYNPNKGTDGKKYWSNIGIDQTGLDKPMNQWMIITADERAAMIKTASVENPVDVSYLIKNASLNRQDGYDMYTKACEGGNGGARVSTTADGNGDRAADYAYEFFEPTSFSFSQNLTGLKAGKYVVMVQGFFRNGNGDAQRDAFNNDSEPVRLAYLFANNEEEQLANITEELDIVPALTDVIKSDKGAFPNMPNAAIEYFQHGAYWNAVEVEVGTDGQLTIGVKKNEKQLDGDWTVFDNFRLIYLGNPALEAAKSDLATLIATAKGLDTTGKTSESVSALNTAISDAETALAAEDATVESLTTAKTNLQTAINNLADIVNGINAIESAAQAGKAFNMQGQQVKKAQKGIYIINNKKVVVK